MSTQLRPLQPAVGLFDEPGIGCLTNLMLAMLSVEDLSKAGADFMRQREQAHGFLCASFESLRLLGSQSFERKSTLDANNFRRTLLGSSVVLRLEAPSSRFAKSIEQATRAVVSVAALLPFVRRNDCKKLQMLTNDLRRAVERLRFELERRDVSTSS